MTNASLSRLSHLVTRLEKRGYLRRQPDPSDGRYTIAILTGPGYKKLVDASPAHVAAVRQLVIDEFTADELEELRTLSGRVTARIDESEWKQELS